MSSAGTLRKGSQLEGGAQVHSPSRLPIPTPTCPLYGCMELLRRPGISGRLQNVDWVLWSDPSQYRTKPRDRHEGNKGLGQTYAFSHSKRVTSDFWNCCEKAKYPSMVLGHDAGLGQVEDNKSNLGLVRPSCSPRSADKGLTTDSQKIS